LRNVFVVSQRQHQFVAGFGILCSSKPSGLGPFAEAIIREGRSNYIECGPIWFGEEWEN
jgi:hypothetical protein